MAKESTTDQEGIEVDVTKLLKNQVNFAKIIKKEEADKAKTQGYKSSISTPTGSTEIEIKREWLYFLNINEKEVIFEKIGQNLEIPSSLLTPMLRDPTLLKPLSTAIMENAKACFGTGAELIEETCVINEKKLESKENIDKFTKLVNQDMQSFAMIQENLNPNIGIEENKKLASALLPAIRKLPPEKMTEQGHKIIKYFAPLLESKNPALVNGTKKVLAELDPRYLTEHGWGENIALELQRVAKPKIWQRIAKVFTGTDYAQQNIDKAFANFEKSSILYRDMKDLGKELKKEEEASPDIA